MTAKQKFLDGLLAKAKMFQDAYEYNKNLPDELFEGLGVSSMVAPPVLEKPPLHYYVGGEGVEIGGTYIDTLREIIKRAGSNGISKSDMVKQFPKNGLSDNKHYTVVTNSLAQLRSYGEVEGFKPKNMIMKGNL